MRNKKILKDGLLLLISNSIVKGLGFVYRVLLVRCLGTACIGLVEMATPIFSFLIVLSGLGLQTAMTQAIARAPQQRFLYLRAARGTLLCTGLLTAGLALLSAPLLMRFAAGDQRILLCFFCLIPAIPIISFASAYRGYLQGLQRVQPIAASQNTEQLVRSLLGVFLAMRMAAFPLEVAAAGPSLATLCGEGAGLLMLLFCMRRNREDIPPRGLRFSSRERKQARWELLCYGLPLTGGRLASSGILLLQSLLIPFCLQQAGWDGEATATLYGQFSGVAMTLLHLPGVFTSALAVLILPVVAESQGQDAGSSKRLARRIQASLKATLLCTVPGMLLLYLFAEPYCILIFDNAPAAPLLRILALSGIFFYLQVSLTSILQGLGEVRRLLLHSLLSGLVLLVCIGGLVSDPRLGISGAALACAASWLTGFLLNYIYLGRRCGFSLGLGRMSLPPLLATGATYLLYQLGGQALCTWLPLEKLSATLLQSFLVGIAYVSLLFLFGGVRRSK